MTERDREAVFNILGDVSELCVLDVYAGSGALGFEALSRGAASVDGIEASKPAANIIRRNLQNLSLADRYHLYQKRIESWLISRRDLDIKYELIFADPPFDQLETTVLEEVAGLLKPRGLFVLKHSSRIVPPQLGIKLIESRRFGDTTISFYRKT